MAKEICELFIRKAMPAGRIPLGNKSGQCDLTYKTSLSLWKIGTAEWQPC